MSNVTETPVTHETTAGEMLVQLRSLAQGVTGYGFNTKGQRRHLTAFSNLPIPFLLEVAVALDASEPFAKACGVTGAEIRDIVKFANAYAPVGSEMILVGSGLRDTVQVKLAEVGKLCLRVYRMAKSFHSPTDRALLIPHIGDAAHPRTRTTQGRETAGGAGRNAGATRNDGCEAVRRMRCANAPKQSSSHSARSS